MTDRIELTGIEVWARHGVLDDERAEEQLFKIDVTLFADLAAAAGSDDLERTVDYGSLARAVHDLAAGESHRLIETLAERVAGFVLDHEGVTKVRVTVHKPQAPIAVGFDDVSVTLERSR